MRGDRPGPTLLLVGGMHGNEPAGATAARGLLARLEENALVAAGEVVAFEANSVALAARCRYVARDLNRQWTPERIDAARAEFEPDEETRILVELSGAIDAVLARARGPVYALDLHTTSADGVPFSIVGASDADRTFAAALAIPGVIGLAETLDGTLGHYLGTRGCVSLAIEGGQHDSLTALANLEAVLTLALGTTGIVPPVHLPGTRAAHDVLERARGDLPPLIQVTSRHEVDPAGGFRMEPGFVNIQRVDAGTLLAHENGKEIRAPYDGFVLLPLYQPQGYDGFFFGREAALPDQPGGRRRSNATPA